jgi:hypothetical protein
MKNYEICYCDPYVSMKIEFYGTRRQAEELIHRSVLGSTLDVLEDADAPTPCPCPGPTLKSFECSNPFWPTVFTHCPAHYDEDEKYKSEYFSPDDIHTPPGTPMSPGTDYMYGYRCGCYYTLPANDTDKWREGKYTLVIENKKGKIGELVLDNGRHMHWNVKDKTYSLSMHVVEPNHAYRPGRYGKLQVITRETDPLIVVPGYNPDNMCMYIYMTYLPCDPPVVGYGISIVASQDNLCERLCELYEEYKKTKPIIDGAKLNTREYVILGNIIRGDETGKVPLCDYCDNPAHAVLSNCTSCAERGLPWQDGQRKLGYPLKHVKRDAFNMLCSAEQKLVEPVEIAQQTATRPVVLEVPAPVVDWLPWELLAGSVLSSADGKLLEVLSNVTADNPSRVAELLKAHIEDGYSHDLIKVIACGLHALYKIKPYAHRKKS